MALESKDLTGRIIGAAIQVHIELGPGFVEAIYEGALSVELTRRGIPFRRQVKVPVLYRSEQVGVHRLDLFVAAEIVVELKAVKRLENVHFAFVRSYLRAVNRTHGLILNFSRPVLEIKRVSARRSCSWVPGFLSDSSPEGM